MWSYCTPCIRAKERGPVARAPPPEASLGGSWPLAPPWVSRWAVMWLGPAWACSISGPLLHKHLPAKRRARKALLEYVQVAPINLPGQGKAHSRPTGHTMESTSSPFLLCRNVNPSLTKSHWITTYTKVQGKEQECFARMPEPYWIWILYILQLVSAPSLVT